jgi:curved DNA-binding protein CbpA
MPGTAGVGMPPRTATGSAMTGVAGIGTPRTSSSPGMQAPAFGAPRAVTDPGMAAVGAPRSASGPAVAAPGFAAPRTASGAMGGVGVARAGTNPGMPAVPFAYSRALLPAEKTMKAQIEQSHAKLAQIDHYAFLGVPQTADDAAIRAAYVTLAREYHPDRLAGSPLAEDPTLREQIESLFKRLGEAQKTLTNAESRARYDRDLKAIASSGGPTTGPNARPRRPTEARTAFVMAETFFKKKEYGQAELHYRQAANFDPEEPMIIVALAWCIFLNPDHPLETRRDDARRRLEEALKKFKSGEAAYRLGRVMRELGDEAAALKLFQIAAKLTPNHVDANRELRIVEMRRGKGDADGDDDKEKKGLIDKLFKR